MRKTGQPPVARKKSKKPKLSQADIKRRRTQRRHTQSIRKAFEQSGFIRVPEISDKEFTFQSATSDFDDAFIFENVVALCEYTTSQESDVSGHLRKKKVVYDTIQSNKKAFLEYFCTKFPAFQKSMGNNFTPEQIRVVIVYCSLATVKSELKELIPNVKYFDYNVAKYFEALATTIRHSARFELLDFLGIGYTEFGQAVIKPNSAQIDTYNGSLLPEAHSNFDEGFKVVSFYMDPDALLKRSYVLRNDGWRLGASLYQRMITPSKIAAIRTYLIQKRRVFVNNIIVTLPSSTKIVDNNGDTVLPSSLFKTSSCTIQIPSAFNTIGIVDGQHRVFSYHEGGTNEDKISKLRHLQNLLVTGIVFPEKLDSEEKLKFEATLFLEINSNQSNAKSALKQEINSVINPFAAESIAKRIITLLNSKSGPLRDQFARFFYDADKLKTTSVVSFGIKLLINPLSPSSLFSVWPETRKDKMLSEPDHDLLNNYVEYCASEINKIFIAVKKNLPDSDWRVNRKNHPGFLSSVNVIGIIACLRKIAAVGTVYSLNVYETKLMDISDFDFNSYKSSQYNKMGEAIFGKYF
jgi:DGQHR domain-containing protein